jgi:hypothetical protein
VSSGGKSVNNVFAELIFAWVLEANESLCKLINLIARSGGRRDPMTAMPTARLARHWELNPDPIELDS